MTGPVKIALVLAACVAADVLLAGSLAFGLLLVGVSCLGGLIGSRIAEWAYADD